MRPLYRPGDSVLHRVPAGPKLVGLMAAALVMSLIPLDAVGTVLVLIAVSVAFPISGQPWHALWAAWWRLRWFILILGVALGVLISVETAVVNTGRIVLLLLLAELVTATTRLVDLLNVIRRVLGPLRRLGVDPDAVAMTLSLTIATIPVIGGFAARVREAQEARGIRLGARTSVPLLVMTMRHADEVGEALSARGIAP
ncbi:biotin transport system permease protein [Microbacterium resistens]|uniref:Biotin transport system permease protein n=1 Tax=Microbacterium resistens TaxID=156977 RepID=A0ABU1SF80_9MICO|nr:energy-coupling factor transporter transmembrane protein EcfT [Microbacterium resistens]MDR6868265.1 biotin transport system permease protein [Microbacterium resistens]